MPSACSGRGSRRAAWSSCWGSAGSCCRGTGSIASNDDHRKRKRRREAGVSFCLFRSPSGREPQCLRFLRRRSSACSCALTSASLAWASASSIGSPRRARMRSASSFAARTAASSMSCARTAVSARTVTTCGCTSRMPPEIAKSSFSPPGRVTTTLPGFRRVISGACLGAMPSSPSSPVATISSASPWKISASALTMSQRIVDAIGCSFVRYREDRRLRGDLLRLLDGFFDAADHVERLLRQVVHLAVDDRLEAADRVLQRNVLARRAGEHFGHVEGLREEALDLARARHRLLVLFGQLVHAQDRDDVLELLVLLQRRLHAARGVVVLVADHVRVELARSGVERVDRGVDAQRGDLARQHDGGVEVGAGDGSVRSSAGTYTAWIEVIEPVLVEVMRSCRTPISSARVGW